MSDETMKIVQLTVENVKRVQAVTVTPNGKNVILGGENEQGKTSILDAISYALGGKSLIPPVPIRKGQKHGRVEVDLGELIVERRFTTKGSTVEVRPKDGDKYPSPQAVLDKLVGDLTFDPLGFAEMKPTDQLTALKEIVGIDFTDLDAKRKALYDERTLANKESKNLEGQLAGIPEHKDAPEQPVSVDSLLAEIDAAEKHNAVAADLERQIAEARRQSAQFAEDAARLEAEIDELRARAIVLKQRQEEAAEKSSQAHNTAFALEGQRDQHKLIDTATLKEQIKSADEQNRKIRENESRKEIAKRFRAKNAESMKIGLAIENIDAEKEQALAEAKFPVDGLGFSDDGVMFKGLPFEQASEEQQIVVSAAIGLALRPQLRVLLIRKAALLDSKHLATLAAWGAANDCQLWIERVGQGQECTVIIENGMVAEEREAAHAA